MKIIGWSEWLGSRQTFYTRMFARLPEYGGNMKHLKTLPSAAERFAMSPLCFGGSLVNYSHHARREPALPLAAAVKVTLAMLVAGLAYFCAGAF